MDEIGITYQHPERGELRVRASVLKGGDVRINAIHFSEPLNDGRAAHRQAWLKHRKGVYVTSPNSLWGEYKVQWACDLANSGVLNAPLAKECQVLAKRLDKAAKKLLSAHPAQ